MIQLSSKALSQATAAHLRAIQQKVDGEPDFERKAKKAEALWNGKGSGSGKKPFAEIKKTLLGMCVGVEICNYCENNEATDIEHLYPKKLFPERAFRWENYLLACKTCNTTDKFAVFNPSGSDQLVPIPQRRGAYSQPLTDDGALINLRTENPLQYLWLDIRGKMFRFVEVPELAVRDQHKAAYTTELLRLNDREALVKARETAAHYYLDRLERYVKAKKAASFAALTEVVQDPDLVDETQPFESEKIRIMDALRKAITQHQHPTVWQELKRQREHLPKTNRLLSDAPEALEW